MADSDTTAARLPRSRGPNRYCARAGLAILIVALAVRVVLIVAQPDYAPVADSATYDTTAQTIARTGHYPPSTLVRLRSPSAFRPPAYPYLLAGFYAVSGTTANHARWTVGRVMGGLLGTLSVALLGVVAFLLWGPGPALCAAALAAVYPEVIGVGDSLLSETLFVPLVLGAIACVLVQRRAPPGYGWAFGAGVLAGLAALTRPNGVFIVIALSAGLVAAWLATRVRATVLLLGATAAVIAPWIVRDALDFHAFVPISTQAGFTLEGTYNDESRADPHNPAAWRPAFVPPYLAILRRHDLDEATAGRKLESLALRYIGDHPTYLAKVGFWNGLRLLQLTGNSREQAGARETGVGPNFSDVARYAFWLLLTLALIAVAAVPAVRRAPGFVWAVPILLLATTLFINSSARYREPIDPFLILAAAPLVAQLAARARGSRWTRRPPIGARDGVRN